ncbi:hypothetical protein [Leisingera sp. JC11]|uniref:hypothetical protein n=1 Tax=Leisingera sp. JC11 TaxID=3042469 RepID=UPI0034523AA0
MSEHAPSLLGLALLVLGPFFILSILAFWAMFRFWGPVAAELGVSVVDRSVSRRVILRGMTGAPDALQRKVQKCRWVFAGVYAGFFGCILFLLGMGGFLFLLGCFALSAVLSRPYVFEGVHK